ncbi:OmpA family protein [Enterovibrio calviensis]|uniref:OmpA family protein n=1 Tax=Enterovibrio calviensis TaxID=91359 RepID=UPI003736E2C7
MKPALSLTALLFTVFTLSMPSEATTLPAIVFEDICADKNTEVAFRVKLEPSTEVLFHRAQYLQLERSVDSHPATPLFIEAMVNAGLNKQCAEFLVRETPSVAVKHNQLIAMVHFGFDKSSLTPTGKKILAGIVDTIKRTDTPLSIEGHTDSVGTHAYNLKLGLQRAESVKGQLVTSVNPNSSGKIKTLTRGETAPIASNKTTAGKTQNRRVEVRTLVLPEDTTSN